MDEYLIRICIFVTYWIFILNGISFLVPPPLFCLCPNLPADYEEWFSMIPGKFGEVFLCFWSFLIVSVSSFSSSAVFTWSLRLHVPFYLPCFLTLVYAFVLCSSDHMYIKLYEICPCIYWDECSWTWWYQI